MILNLKEFDNSQLVISAAETEDEIGTVLRMHLVVEQFLAWFIRHRISAELAPYVKEPREFGSKLSLSVAFGLPLALARVIHQINAIRNKLAHGRSALGGDQVDELARQVDKLVEIDAVFAPLARRYVELSAKRPGERMVFGAHGTRVDFLIAAMAFHGVAMKWAAVQIGGEGV